MSNAVNVTGRPGTLTMSRSATACVRPGIVSRAGPENRHGKLRQQCRVAADMVAVMVRGEYCRQREGFARELGKDGRRVTRIHDHGGRSLVHQPDVVVRECGDRDNCDHGRIFGTGGECVN